MQTQESIIPNTVSNIDFTMTAENPMVSRWGYNPATPGVKVKARETGVSGELIPYGVPIPFNSFTINVENCTMDAEQPREVPFTVTAKAASDKVAEALKDKGYQEFWAGESDHQLVEIYWKICHPVLAEIGVECPFNEEDDFEPRRFCPSCFYDWLTDNLPEARESWDERIGQAVKKGVINSAKAGELRTLFIKANREYIKASQTEWTALVGDYLSPEGRTNGIAAAQHFMRKNIHVMRPADRELHRTAALGEAMGQTFSEALKNQPQSHLTPETLSAIVAQTVAATISQMGLTAEPTEAKSKTQSAPPKNKPAPAETKEGEQK